MLPPGRRHLLDPFGPDGEQMAFVAGTVSRMHIDWRDHEQKQLFDRLYRELQGLRVDGYSIRPFAWELQMRVLETMIGRNEIPSPASLGLDRVVAALQRGVEAGLLTRRGAPDLSEEEKDGPFGIDDLNAYGFYDVTKKDGETFVQINQRGAGALRYADSLTPEREVPLSESNGLYYPIHDVLRAPWFASSTWGFGKTRHDS